MIQKVIFEYILRRLSLKRHIGFQVGEAQGIMGLAFSRLACNPTCITPFFDELVSQENIENIFSISLSLTNGTLVLGGIDHSLYKGSIQYVPMENR